MKYLTSKQILLSSFNFTYAGVCYVGIVPSRKKYRVYSNGVHIYNDIVTFLADYKVNYDYDDLYSAICQFNYLIRRITESMDWFEKNHFIDNFNKIRLKELT